MTRLSKCLLFISVFLVSSVSAFAFPEYLAAFRADAMRKASVDGCGTCHFNPQGGDERNDFGKAFEAASGTITPAFRARFPTHFTFPVSRVSDALIIHFSDPANKQVVVQTGQTYAAVDVEKKTVDGKAAEAPSASAERPAASPAATPARPAAIQGGAEGVRDIDAGLDDYSHEGAFFGASVVNLPNGKPTRKGGVDFWIGHRFAQPVCVNDCDPDGDEGPSRPSGSIGDLFGLDSSALVGYGVRVGLTDRISVAAFRANAFKALEISAAAQLSRQQDAVPVTLQVRGGFEARRNPAGTPFEYYHNYSPFIQVIATRTFYDRVSFVIAPTFAFNTRNEETFFPAEFRFGAEHEHTTALGVGAGVRLRPSVSLVGEYIPRLHGFKGELKNRPGVSIGLQKGTFRHTFELVLSRQEPMTTSQYAFQGTDTFRIGFNIFRRIR